MAAARSGSDDGSAAGPSEPVTRFPAHEVEYRPAERRRRVAVEGPRTAERLERVKHKLATTLLLVAALVVATLTGVATTARPAVAANGPGGSWPIVGFGPNEATDNAILRWNERLLESIRANPRGTGPTVSARSIGILHTATYDAWAAYDAVAVDTRQRLRADPTLRRPTGERTAENKSKAISYAAYRVLLNLFPTRASTFSSYMSSLTYDPNDASTDPATPQGVGNLAAKAVLAFRASDGSNQTLEPGRHGHLPEQHHLHADQQVEPGDGPHQVAAAVRPDRHRRRQQHATRPGRHRLRDAPTPTTPSRTRPPRSGRTSPRSARWTR